MTEEVRWGATPDEWYTFDFVHGLGADLLPVVSNPSARISKTSTLKTLGKTPSRYNGAREVSGIPDWTSVKVKNGAVLRWMSESDYGICIRCREVRAIDFDLIDTELSDTVLAHVTKFLQEHHKVVLPIRRRGTSSKFLLAFRMGGSLDKRVIKTSNGIIEFLGERQQFVAAGTHQPSGDRYYWAGLEDTIPVLSKAQFEGVFEFLQNNFGVEKPLISKASKSREEQIAVAKDSDPLLQRLAERNLIISNGRDGTVNIVCPFEHEHTTTGNDTSTVYYAPHTGGYASSTIKCLHAHCAQRLTNDYLEALGFSVLDDFDVLPDEDATPLSESRKESKDSRFRFSWASEFIKQYTTPEWLIKGVIPKHSLGVVYGQPASGKSFLVLDMLASVSRGATWNDLPTTQGSCVYICGEGSYFFRNRVLAYQKHHGVDSKDLPLLITDTPPDFAKAIDIKKFVDALKEVTPGCSLVVVDTLAKCMVGDENSGADISRVLRSASYISEELGCSVLLVHHSGKDSGKGARGWSGLKGGVDFELEVERSEELRVAKITKQKDAPDGAEFAFRLKMVDVGVGEDLEVIQSCVVEYTLDRPETGVKTVKLSDTDSAVFAVIQDFFNDRDEWPSTVDLLNYARDNGLGGTNSVNGSVKRLIRKGCLQNVDGVLSPA